MQRRLLHAGLFAAYLATWMTAAYLPLDRTDLQVFFWPAADVGAAGHPLLAYAPRGQELYPVANGPLSLLALMPLEWLAKTVSWLSQDYPHKALTFVTFSLVLLLMAFEAVRAAERVRGSRLAPTPRLVAVGALVLAPPVFQSIAGFGHVEQPMEAWLVLLAARLVDERRSALLAGICLGLAVLGRSPAVLFAIPLLLACAGNRGWSRAGRLVVATLVTVAVVMGPFLVADRADVLHSLVFYRGALGVGAGSIWTLTRGTALETTAQHFDLVFAAALAVALNLWLARAAGGMRGARLYAGLAVSAAAFALLAKSVWPYYFFEVYVFAGTWALARRGGIITPALAMGGVIALGLLAELDSTAGQPLSRIKAEGVLMFLLLGAALLTVTLRARREAPA